MKSGSLGVLSAVFASACCGLPLLLVAIGLGGLGLGSFLGAYHWHFTGAGLGLLAVAWFVFVREKRRIHAVGGHVRNARLTTGILAVATVAVAGFGALNVHSALGIGSKAEEVAHAASRDLGDTREVVLPVEGMTCFTCEWGVEKALTKLEGVVEAKASSAEAKVLIRYRPGAVTLERMIEAVDSTGYKASMPQGS